MSEPAGSGGRNTGAQRRSGLRNPVAAIRGIGAAALAMQGVVLLLAIVPLRVLDAGGSAATWMVLGLALASFTVAGLLRHRWAWWLGTALPVVLIACGPLLHLSLGILGVVVALVWLYVLRVRRVVLGRGANAT
jgi:hypothetical protein